MKSGIAAAAASVPPAVGGPAPEAQNLHPNSRFRGRPVGPIMTVVPRVVNAAVVDVASGVRRAYPHLALDIVETVREL